MNGFAAEQSMLPRSAATIESAIDDYRVVAAAHGEILACGALREYSPSLAEVAAVAVAPAARAARRAGRSAS